MSNPIISLREPKRTSIDRALFLQDVLHGLRQPNKSLPCKYFYDERGGELFEQICELDEYYPTRCELAILERFAPEMVGWMRGGVTLLEYGSGSGRKTRLLLDRLPAPAAYLPVDINGEQLRQTMRTLHRLYPHLELRAIEADFTEPFALPSLSHVYSRRVVYFSGSTIGNFEPQAARQLLVNIARTCGPGGGLLLAVDLKKDPRRLHQAYNDRKGITAAFNRNLLARINRELHADFVVDQFDHYAFYNPVAGRIEMHLVSRTAQTVRLGADTFAFAAGESICTEYSHKFNLEDCRLMAQEAGMRLRRAWQDDEGLFSVQYFCVEGKN